MRLFATLLVISIISIASHAMKNAFDATKQFPRVGRVLHFSTKDNSVSKCVGTLIDDDAVLTAAHCVDKTLGAQLDGPIFFQLESESLEVSEFRIHPQYRFVNFNTVPFGDIAVLYLKKQLKKARDFSKIYLARHALPAGERATGVGFIQTSHYSTEFPVPKAAMNIRVKNRAYIEPDHMQIVPDSPSNAYSENGDSGGPLLATIDGEERIYGICSMSYSKNLFTILRVALLGRDSLDRYGDSLYVSVAYHYRWIRDTIHELRQKYGHPETLDSE